METEKRAYTLARAFFHMALVFFLASCNSIASQEMNTKCHARNNSVLIITREQYAFYYMQDHCRHALSNWYTDGHYELSNMCPRNEVFQDFHNYTLPCCCYQSESHLANAERQYDWDPIEKADKINFRHTGLKGKVADGITLALVAGGIVVAVIHCAVGVVTLTVATINYFLN
eukprot:gene11355-3387_t